jgi:hypothetical protein
VIPISLVFTASKASKVTRCDGNGVTPKNFFTQTTYSLAATYAICDGVTSSFICNARARVKPFQYTHTKFAVMLSHALTNQSRSRPSTRSQSWQRAAIGRTPPPTRLSIVPFHRLSCLLKHAALYTQIEPANEYDSESRTQPRLVSLRLIAYLSDSPKRDSPRPLRKRYRATARMTDRTRTTSRKKTRRLIF